MSFPPKTAKPKEKETTPSSLSSWTLLNFMHVVILMK